MKRHWDGMLFVGVVVWCFSFVGVGVAEGPAAKEIRVKVVHADTGAPVAGVRLEASGRTGKHVEAMTDERGESRFEVGDPKGEFSVFYRKEGFVQGSAGFGGYYGRPIPESYTIKLKPGLTVGGFVRDEEGTGVAGAKVRLTFELEASERPGQMEMAYGDAETDAQGRWTFGGAPDKPSGFDVYTPHPDFVLGSFSHRLKFDRFKELREGALMTVIRRGVTIPGVVVDDAGRPVAGAEVTADRSFGLISCVKTDDKGRFELRGVEPGKRTVAVKAEGLAPLAREVVAERGAAAAAVEVRLAKARTLRIRAVDDRGNGVEGVALMVDKWGAGASPSLGVIGKTDAAGEYIWAGAPEGAVSVAGFKGGFRRGPAKAFEGGAAEAVIAMRAESVLKGTVVDDATGAAVERFKMEIGATEKGRRGGMSTTRNGEGGRYELAVPLEGDVYTIRVVADGYLPVQSGALTAAAGGGPIVFDARLKKGKPVTGVVTLADGRPAAGADVVLVDRMAPDIRNGVLSPDTGRQGIVTKTDAAGAFSLPPREGRLRILVVHEAGWNEVRKAADGAAERIALKPWCRVSGRLMKGAAPWAGQKVTLEPVVYASPEPGDYSLRTYFRCEVTTDAEGRFAFDRVVDEEVTLARDRRDHETVLALKPGDRRADLRVGGVGRPVVAKLIVPPDMNAAGGRRMEGSLRLVRPVFIRPGNWEELTAAEQAKARGEFQATAEYRRYAEAVRNIALTIAADGSVRAEDVPAGEYVLSVYGLEPTPGEPTHLRMRGSADTSLVMPAAPGGRGDDPLDAGTLELREHNYIGVGSAAPAFEAATFDGRRWKLSDHRGKYVLLDFWATWCGPCVAEMKHLERLHESLKADGRLVIVSVSVDDRMDEPARFLKERKLPWPQAFAGALGESSARRQFGVGAIPSIWLIDPEGKIVAKEIFGDQIDEAIKKAIKAKP